MWILISSNCHRCYCRTWRSHFNWLQDLNLSSFCVVTLRSHARMQFEIQPKWNYNGIRHRFIHTHTPHTQNDQEKRKFILPNVPAAHTHTRARRITSYEMHAEVTPIYTLPFLLHKVNDIEYVVCASHSHTHRHRPDTVSFADRHCTYECGRVYLGEWTVVIAVDMCVVRCGTLYSDRQKLLKNV